MSDWRLTLPLAYLPAGLSSEVFACCIAAICGMGPKGHGDLLLLLWGLIGIRGEFRHWEKFACVQSMNMIYNAEI